MLQPSTVVTVVCEDGNEKEHSENGDDVDKKEDDSNWQLPLVLASLRVFKDVTSNQNKTDIDKSGDAGDEVIRNITKVVNDISLGCTWTEWGSWSDCSITCGGRGQVVRRRSQTGSRVCMETGEEVKDCHVNLCPVDCEMSLWGDWTSCSRTCGTGIRTRVRNVTRQAENWGKECPRNLEEQEPCLENECLVDGGWSQWSRWGYCSQSCGSGLRSRSRTCSDPAPQYGGQDCVGAKLETKECYLKVCPPIDGGWTTWSRWTACSKSCGWGEQRRTRSCTKPVAAHGGRECSGDRFQNNKCMLRRCPWDNKENQEQTFTEKNQERLSSIVKIKEDVKKCKVPPTVLGFLDPVVLNSNNTNMTEVLPHQTVIYTCSKGWVIDTKTNRRTFTIKCIDDGSYNLPTSWPQCHPPTHCVGPVAKPGLEDEIYLPVPRRDAKVNSGVRYKCKQNTANTVGAGCFHDGRYRYESSWPRCDEAPTLDLCGESSDSDNSNVIIAVPSLSRNSHGWLSSPGYPGFSNRSASCSWSLKAPHGYVLAVGLEEVKIKSENVTTAPLELIQSSGAFSNKIYVKTNDIGQTFITNDNTVTIKSKPGIQQSWRLSYLVVEPT